MKRNLYPREEWFIGGFAILICFTAIRCSSSATQETTTAAVSEALAQSSNSSSAPEVAGLLRGPGFMPDAIEGFRCDDTPEVTTTTVCDQSVPATVHLEWTECAVPEGHGPRGPGPDGAARPPHGDGDGSCPAPPPGACGADGGTCRGGGPPPPGPSSGTVDIVNTYSTPNGCESAAEQQQTATYDVSRTNPMGEVFTVKGTATSTSAMVLGGKPTSKSTVIDITRTVTDSAGAVVRSVHLTGTRTESFSDATPPTRTVNESVTAAFSDGTSADITLTDVVYPPMSECRWPTSGTLVEARSDGTTHTLVYGPACDAATLDGAAIELHQERHGPGGPGGPGAPHGDRGM